MAARKSSGSLLPWLAIAFVVVVLDQATKALIVARFALGDSVTVTPFLNIVRAHNTGAAFSFLAGASGWQRWFFVILGAVAAVAIVVLLARHGGQRLFAWALALILGGALGNLVDRLWLGQVVDFVLLHWRGWSYPAFNLADSAITAGAALLIVDSFRQRRADAPAAP